MRDPADELAELEALQLRRQLRIVDCHGLTPSKTTLAARMVAQLLPICALTAWHVFAALHLTPIGNLLCFSAGLALIVDIGFALFHRKGLSLHDYAFQTQVVLMGDDDAK